MDDLAVAIDDMELADRQDPVGLGVSLVPHTEVNRVWGRVARLLQPAIDMSQGRYTLDDLKRKLTSGEFHLWVILDEKFHIIAAITSTFTDYPQRKFLSGQFLGGERLDEWRDQFCKVFDSWAKDCKCKSIEFTGRAGWSRVLEPNGYKEIYRTYQRDL